ncbi:hypothetical protein F3Y22_tig00110794pilonHSYRG00215 [Hibiscus syriacus]|uniref:RNase H type-1 domain-containing protein n=1 Tax=Hibiscus syriacus TaxID=106335 RepID=A0A6A2ZQC5_HIBSY|nr:hypothetical protein F3Y22_tig00110794pilonHSYRG00215 [Hibiscus syriacus]
MGRPCCLSATALYLLGRSSGRDAELLKTVTRVNQLKELGDTLNVDMYLDDTIFLSAQLLDLESKMIPKIVSISGIVGSETPIICLHSGLRGVIVEETAEQHFLKHNDAGSWIQDSALMLSMCKEVPRYLQVLHSRLEMKYLKSQVVQLLIVESDCKSAVEWIQAPVLAPVFFSPLVYQISTLVNGKVHSVRLIPRACNGEADNLAKKGIG